MNIATLIWGITGIIISSFVIWLQHATGWTPLLGWWSKKESPKNFYLGQIFVGGILVYCIYLVASEIITHNF